MFKYFAQSVIVLCLVVCLDTERERKDMMLCCVTDKINDFSFEISTHFTNSLNAFNIMSKLNEATDRGYNRSFFITSNDTGGLRCLGQQQPPDPLEKEEKEKKRLSGAL